MKEFLGLRKKTDSYLIDGRSEDEKTKSTSMSFMKIKLQFEAMINKRNQLIHEKHINTEYEKI